MVNTHLVLCQVCVELRLGVPGMCQVLVHLRILDHLRAASEPDGKWQLPWYQQLGVHRRFRASLRRGRKAPNFRRCTRTPGSAPSPQHRL